MSEEIILEVKNIQKSFGNIHALNNVSMSFLKGEIHAVIGENGAGKSTLMKILSGSYLPDSGEIYYEGIKYEKFTPKQALGLGISTIYQELCLVNELTVGENIFLGDNKSFLFDKKRTYKKAKELFSTMDVYYNPDLKLKELPIAGQQMIEIAHALSRNVKVLIMDEPSAALTRYETEKMFNVIQKLKERGVTIIYISHRLEELFEISDRITVMRDGEYIDTLNTGETSENDLIKLMVGRDINILFPEKKSVKSNENLMEIKNFSKEGVFQNINFVLKKGEVLGLGGLVGAGRSELARCIFGADTKTSGEILINGEKVIIENVKNAIDNSIAFIPEDRKKEGLVLHLPIKANISMAILKRFCKCFIINKTKISQIVDKYMEMLNIKAQSSDTVVNDLSGGNQQKVVLGKMLSTDSDIIILDEPTRGIDIGARSEIYQIINNLVEQGKSLIIISSDMIELLGLSDRIIVMFHGEISGELEKNGFSQENVMELASGIIK